MYPPNGGNRPHKVRHAGGYSKWKPYIKAGARLASSAYNAYKKYTSTKTKTKRRPSTRSGFANGSLRESVHFNHGRKPRKVSNKARHRLLSAIVPVSRDVQQVASQLTVASYGQCSYGAYHLGLIEDYYNIFANDAGLNLTNSKCMLRSQRQALEICNMSNTSCYLRVYDYIYRHDLPSYNTSGSFISSPSQWNTVMIINGFAVGGSVIASTTLSGNVYANNTFTSYCKVVKQRLIELSPGQVIKLDQSDNKPKSLNANIVGHTLYGGGNPACFAMRGFSRGLLLQLWGQPVDDQSNATLVSTDKCKLSIIQKTIYEYQWISDTSPNSYLSVNSLGAVATAQSINELADGLIASIQA